MNPDIMSGLASGIAEATHQRNLLDLQNRVAGNQLMAAHLLKLSEDPGVMQEGQHIARQGAMDIYGDLTKDHKKTIGEALQNMAHVHVQAGSPGWLGGQTQQEIQAQNMPISTQLAPPPGGPPPTGAPLMTPSPTTTTTDESGLPQVHAGSIGQMTPDLTPPPMPQGWQTAAQAPPPAPPPGTTTTPPPSTYTAPMPAPTPGYTRSGFYTPEESMQMAARGEGMKEEAKIRAQLPAKLQEIQAAGEFKNLQYQLNLEKEMFKQGYQTTFDAQGNPHLTRIAPEDLSAVQQSIIEKNRSAATMAQAQKIKATAEAEYKKGLLDPSSPMNVLKLAQLHAVNERLSMQRTRLGLQEFATHARYYGKDLDGNPLPGAVWDPDIGDYVGTAFQSYYMPTAATRTRGQAADPVIKMGDELIRFANDPANEDLFGQVQGRWADWYSQTVGTNDPRELQLRAAIESFAALIAVNHGWKGAEAPQKFAELMNQKASSKAFAGGVYQLIDAAQQIKETSKPTTKPPAPTSPTGTVRMRLNGKDWDVPAANVAAAKARGAVEVGASK